MALKIQLPLKFADPAGLAIRRADPIMPAAGSLLLVDMSRSAPAGTTVPAGAVENLAAEQAGVLTGATLSSLGLSAGVHGSPTTAQLKMERTARGALHGITTHATSFPAATGYALSFPAAVTDYIYANPAHSYYYSLWATPTRFGTQQAGTLIVGSTDTDYHGYFYGSGTLGVGDQTFYKPSQYWTNNIGTPHLFADNVTGMTGTPNRTAARAAVKWGRPLGGPGDWTAKQHSYVFYRAYLEDLTVSGRTFATVQGLDLQEFDKAFGAGGRYAADTYAAVATLP